MVGKKTEKIHLYLDSYSRFILITPQIDITLICLTATGISIIGALRYLFLGTGQGYNGQDYGQRWCEPQRHRVKSKIGL